MIIIAKPPFSLFLITCVVALLVHHVNSLGSMSSIAASYGAGGPVFCGLISDGSHHVSCFGGDDAIVYGAPFHHQFLGLTAGDGFVCGLLLNTHQPYCWGSNMYISLGVPQPMLPSSTYSGISAGDQHLCAIRSDNPAVVDCWGYNMTTTIDLPGRATMLSGGSAFNCALLDRLRSPFCWGDDTASGVMKTSPTGLRFRSISAGGFHVCGILENSQVFCWGNSFVSMQQSLVAVVKGSVVVAPMAAMVAVVGGRFHACGIKSEDREVVCWGYSVNGSLPPPEKVNVYQIVAGDYFTCAVLAQRSLRPVCWGSSGPWSIPMAVSPGVCVSIPCGKGYYEFRHNSSDTKTRLCKPQDSRVCVPCHSSCPDGTFESAACSQNSDLRCDFNCSSCASLECSTFCSEEHNRSKAKKFLTLEMPIFVAELVFAVVLVISVSLVALLYVRHRLHNCKCSVNHPVRSRSRSSSSFHKESMKVGPELQELKIQRPKMFTYEELERATGGFKEESQVGKGSFSCVFKGVLKDGTVVAVKKAIIASGVKKNSKEFHTELDLLSRLNHAHLLNLLGYCEEGGERLLVYEFMAHGSLYQHLHGKNPLMKEKLDWVRRVTIAVQAARGIEYLHGYACPPVIHRDIKSSNILIDAEQNARVADFGLSLLGPADSSSPLSELPAGTLGYLDPEYYRLHYLTTKSDVYSFGVLLLEILSGRKAIDMQFEEGNIVEWAVPLIKAGNISAILDPVLKPAENIEALKKIAAIACKCVRMRGKDRPSMDKVTTALERALALLMGSPCNEQPILPTEVVLGSSRLHKKSSQRSSNPSCSENDGNETEDQRFEFRAPSWITFPSVTSSQRRKSSASEADLDSKNLEGRIVENNGGDGLRSLEEEIGPASPQEDLFLQHNF